MRGVRGKTEAGLPEQMQRFTPEHGEGNGNPLQCSCLENPMDREWTGCSPWGRTESDTTEATWQQQQMDKCFLFANICKDRGKKIHSM